MNMGSTFDGMLAILQFQSQQDVMTKMMDLAMQPKMQEAKAQAKQLEAETKRKAEENAVELSTTIASKALELIKANPGMDFETAQGYILATMDKVKSN